mmetsp:Transcript_50659/g.115119  ORF Transcript_50659/g.115119 Transcript_50659/m.115119 type:complete len:94 (+) Transcript_50659:111-392(+)
MPVEFSPNREFRLNSLRTGDAVQATMDMIKSWILSDLRAPGHGWQDFSLFVTELWALESSRNPQLFDATNSGTKIDPDLLPWRLRSQARCGDS